jgi:uncharacterized protein
VQLTALDYLAAAGAAGAAGAINALAGGGTLVSFSTLVGIGVPPVTANVTNTVSLVPGYLSGSWQQRDDLRAQIHSARALAVAAFAGGLVGSVLLVTIPAEAFRVVVPYLILLACGLLLGEDRIRRQLWRRRPSRTSSPQADTLAPAEPHLGAPTLTDPAPTESAPTEAAPTEAGQPAAGERSSGALMAVFACAVYGGFFGAGLGIMLLAVLGIFTAQPLIRVNALKQALSFVINLVAAVFFAISGHVAWELVPPMALAAILGAILGTRLVRVINPIHLRLLVVTIGVAVAIAFWVG